MILQITNVEWLMLKDAVSAPHYYEYRYTKHDKKMLSDKLNAVFEEQCRLNDTDTDAVAEVIDSCN